MHKKDYHSVLNRFIEILDKDYKSSYRVTQTNYNTCTTAVDNKVLYGVHSFFLPRARP